jgi:hypothetical protein
MPGFPQKCSQIAMQKNDFENYFWSKPELVEKVEARKT